LRCGFISEQRSRKKPNNNLQEGLKMTGKERLGYGFTEADIQLLRELKYKEASFKK